MPKSTAAQILAQAFSRVNAGKVVRRTTRKARAEGLDPPFDISYVAEPAVVEYSDGLGVSLGSDLLMYDEFPGWRRCLQIFEEEIGGRLMSRVEKATRRWLRKNPTP
jgi:hypothetical protein